MSEATMDLSMQLDRFGLSSFRPGQEEVIRAILDGHDCLCIMPTGGGKSLCYQLPAMARPGTTLVVSPLIALMKDQVDSLEALGISATFVNSTLSPAEQRERLAGMATGQFELMYVAPERLRSPTFLDAVRQTKIQLLAVDEAHCISEWGHDFRPDYARLGKFREQLGNPQTVALTATATPTVRRDVLQQLRLADPRVFISGFARPNLRFEVQQVGGNREKFQRLADFLRAVKGSGIIYASTRKKCVEVVDFLQEELKLSVGLYHAGLETRERHSVQEKFMAGEIDVIVATNAFGMGINKRNLRFVVHYTIPGSLEAYYQEAGRAGRDGLPARCLLLFNHADRYVPEFFIENSYPDRTVVRDVYEFLRAQNEDPIEITMQDVKDILRLSIGAEGVSASEKILDKCGAIKRLDTQQNQASVWIESELPTLVELLPREARKQRKVLQVLEKYVGERRYERVTFSLGQVAAAANTDRESLTRILRELGKLPGVDYVPPFRGRAIHVIDRKRPFDKLEIDFEELQRRKAAEYEKLDRVVDYALARRCRQAVILDYFGETSPTQCGACDNCGGPVPDLAGVRAEAVPHTEGVVQGVRIALSGVARADGRFGKTVIAQMLAGSRSTKMAKFHLDRLSTFGLLAGLTQAEIAELMDELHRQGLLQSTEVDDFRPVLRLSPAGSLVMRGLAPVPPQLILAESLRQRLDRIALKVASRLRIDPPATATGPAESNNTAACEVPAAAESLASAAVVAKVVDKGENAAPPSAPTASPEGTTMTDLPVASTPEESATEPPSSSAARDESSPRHESQHPACYWTWRLLSARFRPRECRHIRGLSLDAVFRHAVEAYEHGWDLELGWLFTADELQALEAAAGANTAHTPASAAGFTEHQWRAFQVLRAAGGEDEAHMVQPRKSLP